MKQRSPKIQFFVFVFGSTLMLVLLIGSTKIVPASLEEWLLHALVVLTVISLTISIVYRSFTLIFEFSFVILPWVLFAESSWQYPFFLYLPLAVTTVITLGFRIYQPIVLPMVWLVCILGIALGMPFPWQQMHVEHAIQLGFSIMLLLLATFDTIRCLRSAVKPTHVDILLCSYSGNTAHYTESFIQGLTEVDVKHTQHRFHYYEDAKANPFQFEGDALVVAFPVVGWKPPWSMFYYLMRYLPKGNGKPAFILYTCAGGAENSFLSPWIILTLKGYVVRGRMWGIYPVNVTTFRIGPKAMWKFFDELLPRKSTLERAKQAAKDFVTDKQAGFPYLIWLFFLVPLGILSDNKFINQIYRNYVWKKRCTKCDACIQLCPSQRIYYGKNTYPKGRNSCMLCFGCVNFCPKNAMQLRLITEYGNRYHPKWRHLLVKHK